MPLADQQLLIELIEPPKTIEQLAEEQGIKPFDYAEARQAAAFWPEDESIDEFLAALHGWRSEGAAEMELP